MMKKIYIKPTMETVQLNVHQPMLTMSLNDSETPVQFSRDFDPFADELGPFSNELDPFAGTLPMMP